METQSRRSSCSTALQPIECTCNWVTDPLLRRCHGSIVEGMTSSRSFITIHSCLAAASLVQQQAPQGRDWHQQQQRRSCRGGHGRFVQRDEGEQQCTGLMLQHYIAESLTIVNAEGLLKPSSQQTAAKTLTRIPRNCI